MDERDGESGEKEKVGMLFGCDLIMRFDFLAEQEQTLPGKRVFR
jgi:hypothetical protein